jgi:ABC-type bacteriocin/lantibiotic exporter with double-glycine peptidase domain
MYKTNEKEFDFFSAISFLSKYIKKHRRNFALFYIGFFFDSILCVIMPIMFSVMIDEIVYYKNIKIFLRISFIVLVLSLFSCILYFMIYTFHAYLMNMYTFDIKLDLFKQIQTAKASYMSDIKSGDVVNTILKDSEECMHFIIRNIFHCGNRILMFLLYIMYIFIISWKLGILVMVVVPLSAYISIKYGRKINKYSNTQRDDYGVYVSWLFEMLKGIKDIRIISAQKIVAQKFTMNHKKIFRVGIKTSVATITSQKIIEFINLVIQLTVYVIIAIMVKNGEVTIGVFTVIITYMNELISSIVYLNQNNMDMHKRLGSIRKVYDFINIETEKDWKAINELNITEGKIEFKNVSFSYKDKNEVLSGINIIIPGGKKFGLIGKSGSGKSTIAGLLVGFYTPQCGEIIIDNQKLSSCSLKSIRKNIGIVQQEVLIFDGTIKENILLGNAAASEAEVLNVCKSAGIYDFINSLPKGIDTTIGSRGVGLSGGQKQRIAIARIYLKNPKIIIFDESTSSLDSKTEEHILNTWEELLENRTAIVIAHRQSSIMLCQRAALIDKGKIVTEGNPYKLCEEDEKFRELFAVKEQVVGLR